MKKGLTPVVSTIVLLAFAVGLGTMVMSWGYSAEFARDRCEDVSLAITAIDERSQVCKTSNHIQMTLENNGEVDISNLNVYVLEDKTTAKLTQAVHLPPSEFLHTSFTHPTKNIVKLRVVPSFGSHECISKRIEVEELSLC